MKKLLTILFLIMLIISFFQITSMYALYKEKIQDEYSTLLGAWAIRVNTKDITTTGQVETFTIANNQLGYVDSEYIQAGKIAPGGQAYFDIVIDPSNEYTDESDLTGETKYTVYSDVSIVYKVDLAKDATSNSTPTPTVLTDAIQLVSVENFFAQENASGQLINKTPNEDEDTIFQDGNSYTSVIPVNMITQGYKNYIRLYFKWLDIDTNSASDGAISTIKNSKLSIPLQINLKQYKGEVIGSGT